MTTASRARTPGSAPSLVAAPPAPSASALEEGDASSVATAEGKSLLSKAAAEAQAGKERRQYSLFEMVVLFSLFLLSGPLLIL
jgi:hypothetical protein